MTAQSIGIFTIEFPDPFLINYYNDEFETLGRNESFQYPINDNIRTLSTKDVDRGNDPYGILYVPDLRSDGCKTSEKAHVPSNTTRLSDLPQDTNYALVAFAPWFSAECTLEYFAAARESPVKAFVVYQPGNSTAMPPIMNDASWGLNDGGSWKSANTFPTYALASATGQVIMDQLSLYSGNITDVPYGHDLLSEGSDPSDFVRLWATIKTESGSQLPSLWVFLVIVLGLLIIVILTTSFFMHLIQRRRRNSLRQRVINGEVDLEALGVKRLTVPREYLEKLPLYTYTARANEEMEKPPSQDLGPVHNLPSPSIDAEMGQKTPPLTRCASAPTAATSISGTLPAFSQTSCPICLDDFEPNETQVRELPCRHIFHPDCVDTFLLSNSSLCPMCKKSVLPSGYCPARITNVMVRRERIISRMRARSAANGDHSVAQQQSSPGPSHHAGPFGSMRSRIGGAVSGRRIFSAPERTQPHPPDIEMANSTAPAPVASTTSNAPEPEPAAIPARTHTNSTVECTEPRQNRREWARQRALALVGNRDVPGEAEDDDNTGPRWRRTLRKVFPGFR